MIQYQTKLRKSAQGPAKHYMRLIYLTIIALLSTCIHAEPTPIRIALVAPFTGTYAAYGTQVLAGATQAANDLNSKGGLKGVKLEIVPIDDQCNPEIALTQAEAIVASNQYQAVIGHVCSAATLASTTIYARAKMLVITPTATNPKITQRNISTLFRMSGNDQVQGYTAAEFIAKQLHSKRVAVLHDEDLYSKDLADIVCEGLTRFDITPILYQAIPRGTRNFNVLAKKIKQLKADAVYFAGLYPEVSSLATTMHALNLQIPFVSGDGLALNKFVHETGPLVANSVQLSFVTEPSALLSSQQVIMAMQKNKMETSGYALYAYAALQVIAAAIENSNHTEGPILANWLHQHEVDTVLGKKSWDTNGDIINADFKMYSWHGENKLELVAS